MSSLIGSLGLNMTFAAIKATHAVGNNRKKDNPTFIDRMRIPTTISSPILNAGTAIIFLLIKFLSNKISILAVVK